MIKVVMPQMGESLAEGTVVRWLKTPGDAVARDEPLFEISTDKVDTEVPSPAAGVLKEILVPEGQTVAVGTPVAVLDNADAVAAPPASAGPVPATAEPPRGDAGAAAEPGGHFRSAHAPELVSFKRPTGSPRLEDSRVAPAAGATPTPEPRPSTSSGRPEPVEGRIPSPEPSPSPVRSWSPAVLEAARRGGLSLDTLTGLRGSGRGGRVTKRDVEAFLRSRQAGGDPAASLVSQPSIPEEYVYRPKPDDRRVPMSPVRRRIAHHMSWSTRISPHATAFAECDMSRAAALLERAKERFAATVGAPLTYTVLVAQAAVDALAEFPLLNASVVGDELVLKPHVHLGVAVALADTDELIVPVVRGADELSLEGLARAIHDLARRARERRLKPEDVQGGTFTLTNPGMFGGLGGAPILNQPQVAILGLGAIIKRPVVVNDAIAIRPVMMMSLTFDHRAADGMVAFGYLARMRELVEGLPEDVGG